MPQVLSQEACCFLRGVLGLQEYGDVKLQGQPSSRRDLLGGAGHRRLPQPPWHFFPDSTPLTCLGVAPQCRCLVRAPEPPLTLPSPPRYQINARTELAVRYNDISPLENHHCAVAFQILAEPECNIFSNIPPDGFKQIRQVRGMRALPPEWGHIQGQQPPFSTGWRLPEAPGHSSALWTQGKPSLLPHLLQGPEWSPKKRVPSPCTRVSH